MPYDAPVAAENPFEDLFAQLGIQGAGTDPAAEAAARKAAERAARPLREVVLAYERRAGGGTVTTVREIPEDQRTAVLGEIKRALGCGGTNLAGLLVFQGDHRERLTEWFEARGAQVRGQRSA